MAWPRRSAAATPGHRGSSWRRPAASPWHGVAALARTGVDRISVGALTHSAPALDIGLDFDQAIAVVNIPLLRRLRDAARCVRPGRRTGRRTSRACGATSRSCERFGFEIEEHPYGGFAYRAPAARLCPDQIEFELRTRLVGRRIAVWNRVGSTNDVAARGAGSIANEGLVVLAEEQTAGRGRRGRAWTAPAGSSLLMSVLLFPPEPTADPGWLTALAALAVVEVVAAWSGRDARIKWPNDVRVDGRKIAGILVERGPGAVIGIGLNANIRLDQFPDELRDSATSLRILTGGHVDRSELARALIERLDAWYDAGRTHGPQALNPRWRERSEHWGQTVEVSTPSGTVRGRLDDLDLLHGLTLSGDALSRRRVPGREVLAITTLAGDGPT